MSFIHAIPWFLFLLPAIPVALHLLTRQRLRTVELSTYRFLFDSYVQQRRRTRFLEALIAMLRAAFVLLLVVLVSRPVVQKWNGLFQSGAGREVILFVDCSASMGAKAKGTSAFDRAKDAAKLVVSRLHPEDRVTLVRVAGKPEEVFSRFSNDLADIQAKIDDLPLGSSRGNFDAAFTATFGGDAKPHANALVYLFTDCQKSGWKEVGTLPADLPVVVVNVGSTGPAGPNLAVVGNPPSLQRAVVGLPVELTPRVVNTSKTEEAEATLSVVINDKEIARTTLKLKPGETVTRKVIYEPAEEGLVRGRFEVAMKSGNDPFPFDDQYLFTLSVEKRMRVLLVNGSAGANRADHETLYLWAALSGGDANLSGDPDATKLLARSMDVRELVESQLTPEDLSSAGVVVLANCGGLNANHFTWLRDYVAAGGGLIVLPGDKVANPDLYNVGLFPVPGPQREQLTPVRFGKPDGDPDRPGTFERFAELDLDHPVLSVFNDPEKPYFARARVKRRLPLTGPLTRDSLALARFGDGSPAIVESRYREGTVIVAAFPAHPSWTNLPSECFGEFVPLVLRLVSYAYRRPEVDAPRVVPPDGVAQISVTASWLPETCVVTDPAGRALPPVGFERSGSRYVAAFDKTSERGYYAAEVRGGRVDAVKGKFAFAVNVAAEESDPSAVTEARLRDLMPGVRLTYVDASAEAQQENEALGSQSEWWRAVIWVLFAVILAEFTLATLGGGRRPDEETPTPGERARRYNLGGLVSRMTGGGRTGE
jgi:hypothetical protein